MESVWCKLHLDRNSIAVGVFYRPPGSSIDGLHSLNQFMNEHVSDFRNMVLMGDFNTPGINWSSLTASGRDVNICNALIDTTLSFGLSQIVAGNTRINAMLDLVFLSSNLNEKGFHCEVIDGISDHKAVLVSLPCAVKKPHFAITSFLDFNQADDNSIIDTLAEAFESFSALSINSNTVLISWSAHLRAWLNLAWNVSFLLKQKRKMLTFPG